MRLPLVLVIGLTAVLATLAAAWAAAEPPDEPTIVRYDQESPYHRIRVVDYPEKGRRCMRFSKPGAIQASMILAEPDKLDLRHAQSMMAALALHPAPADVLLVGLGGACIPKFIQKHFPDIRQTIVEIDPDVVKVCQDWFGFKGAAGTRVIVMDGRMYLKRSAQMYDVILLDAYAVDHIPFHLTTVEFLRLVKSRLKPGGVVAANLWEPGLAAAGHLGPAVSRFYWAELKTYQATFPQTYLCKARDSGKIIVFGTLGDRVVGRDEWVKRAQTIAGGKDFGFDLPALVWTEYEHLTPQEIREKPLTDDAAPVDTLRRENPKYFEDAAAK
jgi:spermidine synthase